MDQYNLKTSNNVRFRSVPVEQKSTAQNFGVQERQIEVQLPDIYDSALKTKEPKSFKEKVKKADPIGLITPLFEFPIFSAITALTLMKGVDAYSTACGGEYEKSLLGKATKCGDRIANSDFWKKSGPKNFIDASKKIGNSIKTGLNKSSLYKSMVETPAAAEWSFASYELLPQEVRIMEDFNKIANVYFGGGEEDFFSFVGKKSKHTIDLHKIGINKAEKEALKKAFGVSDISKINSREAVNWTLLKRLGITESEIKSIIKSNDADKIVQEKMLNALNLTLDDIAGIKKHPEKYVEKVKNASMKVGNKIRIGDGHYKFLGPLQIFERTISLDQLGNKLHSITGGAETKLGKSFATFLHKVHRGFTIGGGKVGMTLMVVPLLVGSLAHVRKAEKDEKIGTAANGIIESVSWVFTLPLAISNTYALGGLQYAGMGKENVEKYRNLIKEFNEQNFTSESAYKTARKTLENQLKELRNVKDQNLLTKVLRKISKFFYQDLGMIKPYQNGNVIGNFARKIPNKLRNIGCVPIRLILCMFGIEGIYRKLIEVCSRAIFGKHYNVEKEMEYEGKKEEQKKFLKDDLKTRLEDIQKEKILGINPIDKQNFEVPESIQKTVLESNLKKKKEEEILAQNKQEVEQTTPKPTVFNNFSNNNNIEEDNNLLMNNEIKETSESKKINEETETTKEEVLTKDENNVSKAIQKEETFSETEILPEEKTVILNQENNTVISPQEEINTQDSKISNDNIQEAEVAEPLPIQTKTATKAVVDNATYIPSSDPIKVVNKIITNKMDNYTYIPSQENIISNDTDNSKNNKYIPSQLAKNFTKTFDNSNLESALKRADKAEQKAIQILSGKFSA